MTPPRRTTADGGRAPGRAGNLAVFASYLVLATLWSWPVARLDSAVLVTRHFDLLPVVWLLGTAGRAPFSLEAASSAWPFGEPLVSIDSFVLLPIGWLLGGVLDPRVLAGLIAWIGPAVGAFAAERCAADAFGVPRPASWVAGAVYGFSGITATALLEGHVYHAFNPWLPLLLRYAWRAQGPEGGLRDGFYAAAAWSLSLLTTGYAGVLGAVILVVVGLRGGIVRLAPGLLLLGLPAGLVYLDAYERTAGFSTAELAAPDQLFTTGSASLGTLAGWSPAIDLGHHSIAAPVGFTAFFLLLAAPVVLRGRSGWRTLFGLSLLSLLVALGPELRLLPDQEGLRSPLAPLFGLPGVDRFRFPIRVTWMYALCGGVVAALVATELLRGRSRAWFAPLALFLIGDAVVGTGLPWRLRARLGHIPSAYAYAPADRAVLDLWARPLDRSSGELEMWERTLTCFYQVIHARPTLEICIGTQVDSPRERVDQWVTERLLLPDPPLADVHARLDQLGVGAVVLHDDLYSPGARVALGEALTAAFGVPAAESADGGEHVRLWRVPSLTQPDPEAAWAAIVADR